MGLGFSNPKPLSERSQDGRSAIGPGKRYNVVSLEFLADKEGG